jgi:hypothetical protein
MGHTKKILFFLIYNFCVVMFIFCARFLFLWETSKKVHNEQNYLFDNTAYFAEIDFFSNNEKVFFTNPSHYFSFCKDKMIESIVIVFFLSYFLSDLYYLTNLTKLSELSYLSFLFFFLNCLSYLSILLSFLNCLSYLSFLFVFLNCLSYLSILLFFLNCLS